MLLKIYHAFVVSLMLSASSAVAFTAKDAKECFSKGLAVAKTQKNLNLLDFIDDYLNKAALREIVTFRAWEVKPSELNAKQEAALEYVMKDWLTATSRLKTIDRDSIILQRYAKPISAGFELSGRYKIDGQIEQFTLIVGPGCQVLDLSWQNVRLSIAIANDLR